MSATNSAALGGINKDSMDPNYSPHAHLHEKAAETAIEHTRFFFDDQSMIDTNTLIWKFLKVYVATM